MGVTRGMRRLWLIGLGLLGVGLLAAALGIGAALLPGVLVLAVAAGRTASLGRAAPSSWLWAAWGVPLLPTLLTLAPLVLVLPWWRGDPLLLFLVVWALGTLALLVWGAFVVAAVVEVLLRRRFGGVPPAWKNDPARPPSS